MNAPDPLVNHRTGAPELSDLTMGTTAAAREDFRDPESDGISEESRVNRTSTGVAAPATNGLYFDDFFIGQSWVSPARTITEADIVNFAGMSGDFNPIHTDAEYARRTQFGERLFHGPGVFAVATGLESRLGIKEGTAIAFLGMAWNLRRPVMAGDTIHVEQTVAGLKPSSSKQDRGVVTFDVQVVNQRDEVVHDGQWVVMFRRL